MMLKRPIQVKDMKANYEIVSYNFECRYLSCTVTSAYSICGEQLQVLTEKLLKRLVRCESEQRDMLGAAAELCHGHYALTNAQQAVEEKGWLLPSRAAGRVTV